MATDDQVMEAIRLLRDHLQEEWISDGCKSEPAMYCASCHAVELERKLLMFETELLGFAQSPETQG